MNEVGEPAELTALRRWRERWRRHRTPVVCWTTIALVLAVVQHISNRVLREEGYSWTRWQGMNHYLDGWRQFDSLEYIGIALHGYWYTPGVRSPIVWFPLYPLLLRAFHVVFSDPMIAGMVVTSIAGLAAAILYWRWLEVKGMSGAARLTAFAVLMLYPYGWYLYGPVQSDALFLALVVGACMMIETDRPFWGGVLGALATATRPTGIAVIPALVVLGLQHDGVLVVPPGARGLVQRFCIPIRFDRSCLRPGSFAPLLSVAGLVSYMVYLWVSFGDPIAFSNNQRVYHPGGMPLLKLNYFTTLRDATDPRLPLTLTGQALVALVVLCCVPVVGRRFGWGYGVFLAVLFAIPTFSTENFMGTGRYMMAAFPAAAFLGERWAQRPVARVVGLVGCAALLLWLNFGYSRSWYLT